ncbi:hypothetical protein GSI_06083 [Ganoderma sinense ZZ0214-1]|uniref:Uncharacterized protein n=1 Tax=Ganoderma sinense ZZ0214-1 TaxID=1077348 RepID=A0A2G8SCA9_9APHY|nr:hypothetical protein GSI_06083 [Ganoderma sinense ZZ0214-1]
MEVAAPRPPVTEAEDKKASKPSSRTGPIDATESPQMLRPPLRKDRRPSLLEQIKQLGTPGHRRRDSEPGKKAA